MMAMQSHYTAEVYTSAKKTSGWKGIGTDDDVHLSIHGTHGVTERTMLDKWWRDDLEPGACDVYKLQGGDVGDILYLTLEKQGNDDWHLAKVVITNNETKWKTSFPFYDWVESGATKIPTAKAVLPFQETNEDLKNLRGEEVRRRQEMYPFSQGNDSLPGFIGIEQHENLPRFVQFHDAKAYDFKNNFDEAVRKFGISSVIETLHSWDKPEDLAHIARRVSSSEEKEFQQFYVDRWDDDTVFGNLFLSGPNPVLIRKCSKLPDNFPVTDKTVKASLQRGLTLEAEMQEGHVYILNYEDLVGLGRFRAGEDVRHCANAMVLLYVRPSGHLVPIAIKLDQDNGPIWTPEDGLGWTMAKIYAKNADVQIHQMGTHLMGTHFVAEAVAITLLRNIPCVHPIYKLIMPHTRHTIAINTVGRLKLVGPGGVGDKTLSISGNGYHIELIKMRYRKRFHWNKLNIPSELASRGVDDAELLPNYHYRDDALLLWNAILEYARQMVTIYYLSDADVVADDELQNFMKELHAQAFPFAEGDLDKQCPDSVRTLSDLITLVTMVIFNCSCQHAAVNFGQFHHMSFPTAYPLALRQPPPDRKWNIEMIDIMAALPDKTLTVAAAAITHALTRYTDTEVFLGEFPEEIFVEDQALAAQANLRQNLYEVTQIIERRNVDREFKYLYLLPERIPSSIAA